MAGLPDISGHEACMAALPLPGLRCLGDLRDLRGQLPRPLISLKKMPDPILQMVLKICTAPFPCFLNSN